jgi:hypothetical protein
MTKREALKSIKKNIESIGYKGYFGLGISLLSFVFTLPEGERVFNRIINVQFVASLISIVSFLYFLYWVYLEIRKLYLEITMHPEVFIIGGTFGEFSASIKIENKEPVRLEDVHIEMIRFSWDKQIWNDIDKFSVGDRFFSSGFSNDRAVSRSPVFIKIAEGVKGKNITRILLDNHARHMPLNKPTSEYSACGEYEMVLKVTGQFIDEVESVSLGEYRTILTHEQIRAHDNWAGQDVFTWKIFEKTDSKKETILKSEREKSLGFTFAK